MVHTRMHTLFSEHHLALLLCLLVFLLPCFLCKALIWRRKEYPYAGFRRPFPVQSRCTIRQIIPHSWWMWGIRSEDKGRARVNGKAPSQRLSAWLWMSSASCLYFFPPADCRQFVCIPLIEIDGKSWLNKNESLFLQRDFCFFFFQLSQTSSQEHLARLTASSSFAHQQTHNTGDNMADKSLVLS